MIQVYGSLALFLIVSTGFWLSATLDLKQDTAVIRDLTLIVLFLVSGSYLAIGILFGNLQRTTAASNLICTAVTLMVSLCQIYYPFPLLDNHVLHLWRSLFHNLPYTGSFTINGKKWCLHP